VELDVEILVANAGFGSYGAFVEGDRARELERGRRVVVPGALNRIGAALGRFSPRPVVLTVMNAG
jgi:hypothetical protein